MANERKTINVTSKNQSSGITAGEINIGSKESSRGLPPWAQWVAWVVAIVGVLGGLVFSMDWESEVAKDDDDKGGDTYNVNSEGQIGGITAGQVNIRPGPRNLGQRPHDLVSVDQILAGNPNMPIKFIVPAGDAEAMTYAIEIRDVLVGRGLNVQQFVSEGMGFQPPLPPLSYKTEDGFVVMQIGSQDSQTQPMSP